MIPFSEDQKVEDAISDFIYSLNDILAEAEVDEPAGRGAGYAIYYDEKCVKEMLLNFKNTLEQIQ